MNASGDGGMLSLQQRGDGAELRLAGEWTLANFSRLTEEVAQFKRCGRAFVRIDAASLSALDTAGAALILELLGAERLTRVIAEKDGLKPPQRALLQTVVDAAGQSEPPPVRPRYNAAGDILERIGAATVQIWRHATGLLGFIGIVLSGYVRLGLQPRRWRMTSLAANLEQVGLDAVPIVALLTFLVGAVIAFLGATLLSNFGATVFTVSLVGFSFLREFGVLLAAILVAGRTASAFAAQIGSMRANEEIDAIRVQGLDPVEMLVLPRVSALLLALPMLTFIAMICGIAGGMAVCAISLDIPPAMFLDLLRDGVSVRHFFVGIVKAPFFALLIAVIGCMEGFKVSGSAQSVGEHTTSAVVQSIFVVILLDAIAALFCMEMGW